jgi:hypothetical protein
MKSAAKLLRTSLWIACLCLVLCGSKGHIQQPQAVLRVSPSSSRVLVGRKTTISLVIEQVSGLYGAQIRLRFDPAIVEVVDADFAQEGVQAQQGAFPTPDFVVQNAADNITGTIDYAVTQLQPNKPSEGQGTICSVTLLGKKAGVSPIQIEEFLLADTAGTSIGAVSQNGVIQVRPSPPWLLFAAIGLAILVLISLWAYYVHRHRKRD